MYSLFTGPSSGILPGCFPGALLRLSISNPDVCLYTNAMAYGTALQFYMKRASNVNETEKFL
jgi:hypothetical protein